MQEITFSLKHQLSNLNKVVDALGRWVTLLSTIRINVSGFNIFCELYLSDFSFRKIYAKLSEGGKLYTCE